MSSVPKLSPHCNIISIPSGAAAFKKSQRRSMMFLFFIVGIGAIYALQSIKTLDFTKHVMQPTSIVIRYVAPKTPELKDEKLEKIVVETSEFKVIEPKEIIEPVPEKPKKEPPVKQKPIKKEVKPVEPIQKPAGAVDIPEATQPPTPNAQMSASEEKIAKESIFSALLREVEKHKRYPRNARKRGTEGTVYLLISINSTGSVTSVSVPENNATASVLQNAGKALADKLVGFNTNIKLGKAFKVRVPIEYALHE